MNYTTKEKGRDPVQHVVFKMSGLPLEEAQTLLNS